ncbi:MAG: M28 family peptidase [Ignavibacteriaceae bacterium]
MIILKYVDSSLLYLITIFLLISKSVFPQTLSEEKVKEYKTISELIVRESLTGQKGYKWLQELCDIGPRLSGSENSLKAIYWAENKMKELGFDSVWLQPVMVPHWVRGEKESATLFSEMFQMHELNILALGRSIGTPPDGITAEVIEVRNFKELEERKDEVKGKIVFFGREADAGLVNTFAAYGGAVDQRVYGAIEAAKYGAVGVLIRSITTKYDNVPHTGSMIYVDSLPKIPAAAMGYLDADFLHNALLADPELKVNIKMDCKTLPDILSYNVIGEITGSEFPDEVIVVGGHFDSWDTGCGAHDDGAGCIQAMEVADLFSRLKLKPKRTVRCVLFINEENGSRGGKEYGVFADTSGQKHIAAIESDRGAFTPVGFSVDSDSLTLSELQGWIDILSVASIEWIKKGGSGVDISYIKNAKCLMAYVPDDQRYFDLHHSANDTFDKVHPRELQLGTAAITIMTWLLSEEGL